MLPFRSHCLLTSQIRNALLKTPTRNVTVSVVGAASDVGSHVSLLLKQNPHIKHLHLYDDDLSVTAVGMELEAIPQGPELSIYSAPDLSEAIKKADLVVMLAKSYTPADKTSDQMLVTTAPEIQRLCKAFADNNPYAFLAISTNPINSVVPLAASLLRKYNAYNPLKLLGITQVDNARSRAIIATSLRVKPSTLDLPVICGHSEQTIVPLFSNLTVPNFTPDDPQSDWLTRLVRKTGADSFKRKTDNETLVLAWSITQFVMGVVTAIQGNRSLLSCFTENKNFGTKYFAGPTLLGGDGIVQLVEPFNMSEYEKNLLHCALPVLTRDIAVGETYFRDLDGSKAH